MQVVSDAWKELQKQSFIPGAYVEIGLNITDDDAEDNKTLNLEESSGFDTADPTDKNANYIIISNDASGDDGTFDTPPSFQYLTYNYNTTLPGIVIAWNKTDGEYATDFVVTISTNSDDPEMAATQILEIHDNTEAQRFIRCDIVPSTCTVIVQVNAWSVPGNHCIVEAFEFGAVVKYGRDDIMNYSHSNTADPISASASVNEISFDLRDLDGIFNIDNKDNISAFLMERQRITVRYGFDIDGKTEWIRGGVFYLTGWDSSKSRLYTSFTARDCLGLLTAKYIGEETTETTSLREIVESVLEQANLPELERVFVEYEDGGGFGYYVQPERWVLTSRLGTETEDIHYSPRVGAGIDLSQYTLLEILQYAANASMCVLFVDRKGQIHMEPFNRGLTDYVIDMDNSYSLPVSALSEKIKAVNVNDGSGTFYLISKQLQKSSSLSDISGEVQYVDNPFISDTSAYVIAQWIARYLYERETFSGNFRPDPRLDVLDVITVKNQYATKRVAITNITFQYNGGFTATFEGRVVTTLNNMITNGSFQRGADGWVMNSNSLYSFPSYESDANNIYASIQNEYYLDFNTYPNYQNLPDRGKAILAGHQFYISADIRWYSTYNWGSYMKPVVYLRYYEKGVNPIDGAVNRVILDGGETGDQFWRRDYAGTLEDDEYNSTRYGEAPWLAFAQLKKKEYTGGGTLPTTEGAKMDIDDVVFIDLTEAFGDGIEPDAAEIREMVFDTYSELTTLYKNDTEWYWNGVNTYEWNFGANG